MGSGASSCCFPSLTMKSEHLSLEVSSFAELMTCADSRRTSSVAHARAWARESIVSDLRYSWLATWTRCAGGMLLPFPGTSNTSSNSNDNERDDDSDNSDGTREHASDNSGS